jgi:integral membrane protein (TIGR00529 family)
MDRILKDYLAAVILAAGLITALGLGMDWRSIALWTGRSLHERQTVELVLIIYLVLLLGEILEAKKSLDAVVRGLTGLLGKKALVTAIAPAFIGLLPMPGGALVSAPLLDKALGKTRVSPALKTFLNYWFRHVWEYSWPLYPGLIITAAVFGVRVVDLIRAQFAFTLIAVFLGALSIAIHLRKLEDEAGPKTGAMKSIGSFLSGGWEILLVVVLIVAAKIHMLAALGLAVMLSLLLFKSEPSNKIALMKKSFKVRVLAVLVAVMIFKNLVLHSSMAGLIEDLVSRSGAGRAVFMFLVPFFIGLLTGVNQSYAGIAFPIFIPIVGAENPDVGKIAFLYISGFAGVLLSPVHLCLVLSAQYYGANLAGVYRYLLPPVAVILLLAAMIYAAA